jgi:hypothetical protein
MREEENNCRFLHFHFPFGFAQGQGPVGMTTVYARIKVCWQITELAGRSMFGAISQ